jgi:hypothetical protein
MANDKIIIIIKKKTKFTQVNSTNLRSEISDMDNPTKRKVEQITKLKAQ